MPKWRLLLVVMLAGNCAAFLSPPAAHLTGLRPPRMTRGSLCSVRQSKPAADSALEGWADSMGVERAVEIANGKFGRGLIATRDLEPGDAAVRVPL